ncbi:MAG: DUF2834 domain-containing protein [Cyclobacteriaceae bacterium]
MKRIYLLLSTIGFILPNIWVLKVTFETGNVFLYGNPVTTTYQAFANDISTAFMTDLLFTVVVFMVWSYREAKKYTIPRVWVYWVLTFLFGIAGTLPLFLYMKEGKKAG